MNIVFWDIETTDLKALMGRVLACSFLEYDKNNRYRPYTFRCDAEEFDEPIPEDSKIVTATRDELETYDLIVGHNIRMFDIPFLNARLAKYGERPLRTHFVLDTLYYVGYQMMRIGSKRLDNVQRYFGLSESKTPIDWADWQRAAAKDVEALDRVVVHNVQDVKVLRELYPIIIPYVATLHR